MLRFHGGAKGVRSMPRRKMSTLGLALSCLLSRILVHRLRQACLRIIKDNTR